MFSDAGSTGRNVHNDACFLDKKGNKVDGPASFYSEGVGVISACPDPAVIRVIDGSEGYQAV